MMSAPNYRSPLTDEDWDLLRSKLPIVHEILHLLRSGESLALHEKDLNFLREALIALETLRSLLEIDANPSGIFTGVNAINSRVDVLQDVRELENWFKTLAESFLRYAWLAKDLRSRYDIPLKSNHINRQYEEIESVLSDRSYGSLERAAFLCIQTFGVGWINSQEGDDENEISHRLRKLVEKTHSHVVNTRKTWSDFKKCCEEICKGRLTT
jgi:hypothetical protein